jgi:hypothetical protein
VQYEYSQPKKFKDTTLMNDLPRLKQIFIDVQAGLEHDLRRASQGIVHPGTKGEIHEDSWIAVLRNYLPNRYAVGKGIVIDSKGGVSDQIDVVIYDPQYTPLLYVQQHHKFIPIEAVYAVFECKPEINKGHLEYAGDKVASVRQLHRTSIEIVHAGGTYPKKPIFDIIGGILAASTGWQGGLKSDCFTSGLPTKHQNMLDCGCALSGGAFNFYRGANAVVMGNTNLMYFLFNLLSALQTLATVPAIDWQAYAAILDSE